MYLLCVGRWHAHTLKKASSARREETDSDLQKLMQTIFANITMNQKRIDFDAKDQDQDQDQDLPLQKVRVERVEKLGGTGTGLKLRHISKFVSASIMQFTSGGVGNLYPPSR